MSNFENHSNNMKKYIREQNDDLNKKRIVSIKLNNAMKDKVPENISSSKRLLELNQIAEVITAATLFQSFMAMVIGLIPGLFEGELENEAQHVEKKGFLKLIKNKLFKLAKKVRRAGQRLAKKFSKEGIKKGVIKGGATFGFAAAGGYAGGRAFEEIDMMKSDSYTYVNPDSDDIKDYEDIMEAGYYLDEILWGLPGKQNTDKNIYQQIDTCEFNEEEEEEGEVAPPKYIFNRVRPKGDALSRMGLSEAGTTNDKGILFSMVEDILDIDPLRFFNMETKNTGKYKNCMSVTLNEGPDTAVFHDINGNPLPQDKTPAKGETIEFFTQQPTKNNKINCVISVLIFILIFILLYKLLKNNN